MSDYCVVLCNEADGSLQLLRELLPQMVRADEDNMRFGGYVASRATSISIDKRDGTKMDGWMEILVSGTENMNQAGPNSTSAPRWTKSVPFLGLSRKHHEL